MEKFNKYNKDRLVEHFDDCAINYEDIYLRAGYPDPQKCSQMVTELAEKYTLVEPVLLESTLMKLVLRTSLVLMSVRKCLNWLLRKRSTKLWTSSNLIKMTTSVHFLHFIKQNLMLWRQQVWSITIIWTKRSLSRCFLHSNQEVSWSSQLGTVSWEPTGTMMFLKILRNWSESKN